MSATQTINGTSITIDDNERQECEIYDRVVGYFRPISGYNTGKAQEQRERTRYSEESSFIDSKNEREYSWLFRK